MKKYERAIAILDRYYEKLLGQVASGICENKSRFDEPMIGLGEELLFNYTGHLQSVCVVVSHLRRAVASAPDVVPVQVEEIQGPRAEITQKIGDWLAENPHEGIVSVTPLPPEAAGALKADGEETSEEKAAAPETLSCLIFHLPHSTQQADPAF